MIRHHRRYGLSAIESVAVDGNYFLINGKVVILRGLTAFMLWKRFCEGRLDEANAYLDWAASVVQANWLRVFSRVNWRTEGVEPPGFFPDDWSNYEDAGHQMLDAAARRGIVVQVVAHTYRESLDAMLAHSARVDRLTVQHANAIYQDANEPARNNIDIDAIAANFTPMTLAGSGQYDPTPYPGRVYGNDHTPRDDEHVRKFKAGYEYYEGSGPYAPFSPPFRGPILLDEPARIEAQDTPDDWKGFAAGACMFDAGVLIHGGEWAQKCIVPTDSAVLDKIYAVRDGCAAVPVQKYSGYLHPDDQGSLRRYRRQGSDGHWYEVSVRPYDFKRVS